MKVQIPESLQEELRRVAKNGNVTVSWLVRDILIGQLKRLPKSFGRHRTPGEAPSLFPDDPKTTEAS